MNRLVVVLMCAALLSVALPAVAQEEDQGAKILEQMRKSFEEMQSMHLQMTLSVKVQGMNVPITAEIWFRKETDSPFPNMRMEMSTPNMVQVMGPDGVKSYMGMMGVMLHILPETMQKFQDQVSEAMKQFGLGNSMMDMMKLMTDIAKINVLGEEEVEGADCWLVEFTPESLEKLMEMGQQMMPGAMGMGMGMGGGMPEMSFTTFKMALEKETCMVRRIELAMSATMPNGVQMAVEVAGTMPVAELNVEIEDEMFTFEVPEGTKVIEWTPDKTMEEIQAEMQQAAQEAMQNMQQQGGQQQ